MKINKQLRDDCAKARSKYDDYLKVAAETKSDLKDDLKKRREAVKKELEEKIERKKLSLAKSSKFCSSSLFEPVYSKEERNKRPNVEVKATTATERNTNKEKRKSGPSAEVVKSCKIAKKVLTKK